MLVIQNEVLEQRLQAIAKNENRPVEAVLEAMLASYSLQPANNANNGDKTKTDAVKRVRQKAYVKARQYWQEIGDTSKLALTDEQLDEQFGAFDENGIPRLKSELDMENPPVGSLAYASKIARVKPVVSFR